MVTGFYMANDNEMQLDNTFENYDMSDSAGISSDQDKLTARRKLEEYMEMKKLREQLEW